MAVAVAGASAGQQASQERGSGLAVAGRNRAFRRRGSHRWERLATRSPVLLVVQLVARAAQDHDVVGQFAAEAFVGAVVRVEVFGVGDVQ